MRLRNLFIMSLLFLLMFVLASCSGKKLSITGQPQNATVSYPQGASFSVKVSNPEKVASYQWYLTDQAGNVFELAGITAKTADLIVPSSQGMSGILDFHCVVTDKDGNELHHAG